MRDAMKNILFIVVATLILNACATQPSSPYRPAEVAGYGYTEKSLGENRYRIEFKIANNNVKKAQDYARLRAAELTTNQGYDWFEVKKSYSLDKDNNHVNKFDVSKPGTHERITRDCGLLGCRTQVHTLPKVDDDEDMLFPETVAALEIQLGKGIRPAKAEVFDAIETSEDLRSKLLLQP
jgi:hypothetical protein